ncbi:hypothetical protein DJ64_18775 [Streptomyces griseorubens]|uniref:Uncharacterized protein n=1 Tax=Streptomyces griseorubens TaxID=66897 RepID=A0ABR4SUI4_9ACTN|nr:hypothetical protein DJ64_18775 [Streptomyces griseorubens]
MFAMILSMYSDRAGARDPAKRTPMSEVGGIFDADRHGAFADCHGVGRPAVVVTVLPERSS